MDGLLGEGFAHLDESWTDCSGKGSLTWMKDGRTARGRVRSLG